MREKMLRYYKSAVGVINENEFNAEKVKMRTPDLGI
jgi:hypothetical protein